MHHKKSVFSGLPGSFRLDGARFILMFVIFVIFFFLFRFGMSVTNSAIDSAVQDVMSIDIPSVVASQDVNLVDSITQKTKRLAYYIVFYGILFILYMLVLSFILLTALFRVSYSERDKDFISSLRRYLGAVFSDIAHYGKGVGLGLVWFSIFFIPLLIPALYILQIVSGYDIKAAYTPAFILLIISLLALHFIFLSFYFFSSKKIGFSIRSSFMNGIRLHKFAFLYILILVSYLFLFSFFLPALLQSYELWARVLVKILLFSFLTWAFFYYALVLKLNFPFSVAKLIKASAGKSGKRTMKRTRLKVTTRSVRKKKALSDI